MKLLGEVDHCISAEVHDDVFHNMFFILHNYFDLYLITRRIKPLNGNNKRRKR